MKDCEIHGAGCGAETPTGEECQAGGISAKYNSAVLSHAVQITERALGGISQTQLAHCLHCSRRQVFAMQNQRAEIRDSTLDRWILRLVWVREINSHVGR